MKTKKEKFTQKVNNYDFILDFLPAQSALIEEEFKVKSCFLPYYVVEPEFESETKFIYDVCDVETESL